jgi:hypothetical protein
MGMAARTPPAAEHGFSGGSGGGMSPAPVRQEALNSLRQGEATRRLSQQRRGLGALAGPLVIQEEVELAGELGLEPRMTVPKTAVLPLHHSPAGTATGRTPREGVEIA